MRSLEGRVAIVTGAGSVGPGWGNGKATAVLLAREGSFCVPDRRRRGGGGGDGGDHRRRGRDFGRASVRHAGRRRGGARGAGVHVAVRARSISWSTMSAALILGTPADMPEEVWDRQIDYNLKTAFLGCKYVLPVMEARGRGAIVNVSSVAGLRILAGRSHVAYTASKAGVIAFSKSVAIAYAKQGIRCNTVVPGLMHTPLVEHRLTRQLGANDAAALDRAPQCAGADGAHGRRLGRGACGPVPGLGRGQIRDRDRDRGGWRADCGQPELACGKALSRWRERDNDPT